MSAIRTIVACALAATLSGCGLYTPEMYLFNTDKLSQGVFENMIVNNIQCELRKGVQDTLNYFQKSPQKTRVDWLKKYGAMVQLKLTADELSSVAPGVSYMNPFRNMQSFALGLGASGTAHGTRTETISFAVSFSKIQAGDPIVQCDNENGVMVQSDLKIAQFIFDKAFTASVGGSVEPFKTRGPPYTVLTDELTFVAAFGGSVTPTWKLTKFSADTSGTLLSATRTKTNDVIITLGLVTHEATLVSPVVLSTDAQIIHNALVTGSAVGTANSSQTH